MQQGNIVSGTTADEIWQQINHDFDNHPDPLEYNVTIDFDNHKVNIDIDIDLGGGFESGYETTTFLATLPTEPSFKFAIHKEHFTDEIGKFFGMQDVELGYPEFDKKLIIKTNDGDRLHHIFADAKLRAIFQNLENFTFGITRHHAAGNEIKDPYPELTIEEGITDVKRLREVFDAFYTVLVALD